MAIKRQKPVFTAFLNPDLMTRFEIEIQLMSPLDEWFSLMSGDRFQKCSPAARMSAV